MRTLFKLLAFSILVISCASPTPTDPLPISSQYINQLTLAEGFQIPFAIEVLGEDDFLVTERMGGLFRYQNGELTMISGMPASQTYLADRHYGGMMDISLHPEYSTNGLVYLAYVKEDYSMSVIRFTIDDRNVAQGIQEIFTSDQFSIGARIAWQDSDHFFLTFGVGGSPTADPGPQDLDDPRGKIFRLKADGTIPSDNPVFEGQNSPSGVWSYGHRDPQGLAIDRSTGIVYSSEHGPLGGDEINIIEKGGNYGWPLFSYGLNYDMSVVSNMTEEEAAEVSILPMKHWTPAFRMAPSSLVLIENSNFTEWNGSFLIGALLYQQLVRYDPESDKTETLIEKVGRVRDIAVLPSGDLVILIEENSPSAGRSGRIVKLSPGS